MNFQSVSSYLSKDLLQRRPDPQTATIQHAMAPFVPGEAVLWLSPDNCRADLDGSQGIKHFVVVNMTGTRGLWLLS